MSRRSNRAVPTFVGAKRLIAELDISLSTFHGWRADGIIPPPSPGFPPSSPRWLWSRVVAWLEGDRSDLPTPQASLFGEGSAQLVGHRRRGRKRSTSANKPDQHAPRTDTVSDPLWPAPLDPSDPLFGSAPINPNDPQIEEDRS